MVEGVYHALAAVQGKGVEHPFFLGLRPGFHPLVVKLRHAGRELLLLQLPGKQRRLLADARRPHIGIGYQKRRQQRFVGGLAVLFMYLAQRERPGDLALFPAL